MSDKSNETLRQAYSVRAKCRKGLERLAEASGAPKGLKLALSKAMAEADAWVNSLRAELYGDEEDDAADPVDESTDTSALEAEIAKLRKANASLKAEETLAAKVAPTVRKAVQVTRINAR